MGDVIHDIEKEIDEIDEYVKYILPSCGRVSETGEPTTESIMCDDELKEQIFTIIKDDNAEELKRMISTLKKIEPTTVLCDETGMNMLHYAIHNDCNECSKLLLDRGPQTLMIQNFSVNVQDHIAERNALHIISEKGNMEYARIFIKRIGREKAQELMAMETAMDIKNHRWRTFTCLHITVFYGHYDLTAFFVDKGAYVNIRNSKNETPLFWAARFGHQEIVTLLLSKGADPNLDNDKGTTPLYMSIRYNHPDVVNILTMDRRTDVNQQRKVGFVAPIILASVYGYLELVENLINAGADVNVSVRGGDTALHKSASEGYMRITKLLVENHANVNKQDEHGNSPLLLAVAMGNADIVDYLMENHADLTHKNHEGLGVWHYALTQDDNMTLAVLVRAMKRFENFVKAKVYFDNRPPMCTAASIGATEKIPFLLDIGLSPLETDNVGNNVIHHAAMRDNIKAIDMLKNQVSLDLQNKLGDTALHLACFYGKKDTIKLLLKNKARADLTNDHGRTALHYLAKANSTTPEMVSLLVDYMSKVHSWDTLNAQDMEGNSALHIASMHATVDVIWQLGSLTFRNSNKDGCTPFHTAVSSGNPEVLQILLNIYEDIERDADLNTPNESLETVLHLAADAGDSHSVKRLITFGADLSAQDDTGSTVLHRLANNIVNDEANQGNYEKVVGTILQNLVRWWTLHSNLTYPYDDTNLFRRYKRQALRYLIAGIQDSDNLTVINHCALIGCKPMLDKLLMVPNVNYILSDDVARLDISYLTPQTCKGLDENYKSNISCIGMVASMDDLSIAGKTLDVFPLTQIEGLYANICAWTYAFVMIMHLFYMTAFTWLSISAVKEVTEFGENKTPLLYYIVPIEPALMLLIGIFFLLKFFCHSLGSEKGARTKLIYETRATFAAIKFLEQNMSIIVGLSWSLLVFAWLYLFHIDYTRHIYFLSTSLWLGWLYSISFTRGFKHVHYFWRMLKVMVVRDIIRFLFVYMFVLIAFSMFMHAVFEATHNIDHRLGSAWDTMFLTFTEMLGLVWTFEYKIEDQLNESGHSATPVKVFVVLYLILGTVVLLNLLIAMMNDSFQTMKKSQSVFWRVDSVRLGLNVEEYLPWARTFFTPVRTYYENIDVSMDANTHNTKDVRWFIEVPIEELEAQLAVDESDLSHKIKVLTSHVEKLSEKIKSIQDDIHAIRAAS